MRQLLAIWRRELAACFLSPVAYVTMMVFIVSSNCAFVAIVMKNDGRSESMFTILFASITACVTFLITVISMRLFAEENRSGTIETLVTAPVNESAVVLGKYLGALSFLVIVILPSISSIFILAYMSPVISMLDIDIGAVLGGFVILLLVSGFCLSAGMVVSILTRNQIIAAISCFCVVWLVLISGWLVSMLPGVSPGVVEYISSEEHMTEFARGSVDSRPIVMYLSGTVFMLFAATRLLEFKRWR